MGECGVYILAVCSVHLRMSHACCVHVVNLSAAVEPDVCERTVMLRCCARVSGDMSLRCSRSQLSTPWLNTSRRKWNTAIVSALLQVEQVSKREVDEEDKEGKVEGEGGD